MLGHREYVPETPCGRQLLISDLRFFPSLCEYPETPRQFEAAMRDGAEGIESVLASPRALTPLWRNLCCPDVHVSVDDVVIMFHDPSMCMLAHLSLKAFIDTHPSALERTNGRQRFLLVAGATGGV